MSTNNNITSQQVLQSVKALYAANVQYLERPQSYSSSQPVSNTLNALCNVANTLDRFEHQGAVQGVLNEVRGPQP